MSLNVTLYLHPTDDGCIGEMYSKATFKGFNDETRYHSVQHREYYAVTLATSGVVYLFKDKEDATAFANSNFLALPCIRSPGYG
jgi:hypothetical protein